MAKTNDGIVMSADSGEGVIRIWDMSNIIISDNGYMTGDQPIIMINVLRTY